MTNPQPVKLERRTPAGQLRYLAANLNKGEVSTLSVALALEVLAGELESPQVDLAVTEREQIAAAIEAAIVTDPADRYERWPCDCLDGKKKCYPHLAAEAMNAVTAQDGYEDWPPVIQAGALWDALEPVILCAAASIARPW